MEKKELKHGLIESLLILRTALKSRDIEDAHNMLIDGSYDYDRDNEEESEKMEKLMEIELEDFLIKLNNIIDEVWEK